MCEIPAERVRRSSTSMATSTTTVRIGNCTQFTPAFRGCGAVTSTGSHTWTRVSTSGSTFDSRKPSCGLMGSIVREVRTQSPFVAKSGSGLSSAAGLAI
jgi:hypothetical protein